MSGAAGCGEIALWAAGLCAVTAAGVLLALLPRDRGGLHVGLAGGVAVGMFVAAAWHVSTACRIW